MGGLRMVEARQAVELAEPRLDMDIDFSLAILLCDKLVDERREGLQTAIEGRRVDEVDGWLNVEEMLAQLIRLLSPIT